MMLGLSLALTQPRGREPRRNLLIWTDDLSTIAGWAQAGSVVTGQELDETAATSTHVVQQAFTWSAGTYTGTVEMKAAERSFGLLALAGTAHSIGVNLATGAVVTSAGTLLGADATDAGSGWWRVRLSVVNASTGSLAFNVYTSLDGVFANRSYAGTAGSGILVRRAQLELGSAATPYQSIGATY